MEIPNTFRIEKRLGNTYLVCSSKDSDSMLPYSDNKQKTNYMKRLSIFKLVGLKFRSKKLTQIFIVSSFISSMNLSTVFLSFKQVTGHFLNYKLLSIKTNSVISKLKSKNVQKQWSNYFVNFLFNIIPFRTLKCT